MKPERVFQTLLFTGLVAGGWLYGDYWRKNSASLQSSAEASELRAKNSELIQEVDQLDEQLAQLRSILASGPYPISDVMISWIEREHGMVFLKAPDVRLASPMDLREAANRNLNLVHGETGLDYEGLAWEYLGILPPNQRLKGQFLSVASNGVKGVFDLKNERILLSEDYDSISIPDQSVLVRLLGQLLAFQNHPRKEWASRDDWQAWEAVFTGAAAALQDRFLRRNATANKAAWANPESEREELLKDLAPALAGFCNSAFVEGVTYTGFFYNDSRKAFAEMFRKPPSTTRKILHPNHTFTEIPAPTPPSLDGETVFQNNLGELGFRLWLATLIDQKKAEELASGWVFDRYFLQRRESAHTLLWQIMLETPEKSETVAVTLEKEILPDLEQLQPNRSFTLLRTENLLTLTNSPKPE
jgi:hypothetical protein